MPEQFVTTTSVLTFGGASTAVWIISATVQRLVARTAIWIPFLVSLCVGFLVAYYGGKLTGGLEYFIAFVNCCLLFCTATGINETASAREGGGLRPHGAERGWIQSWFQ